MISRFRSRALSAVSSSPSLGCTSGSRSAKRVCTTMRTWPAAARVASALPSSSVSLATAGEAGSVTSTTRTSVVGEPVLGPGQISRPAGMGPMAGHVLVTTVRRLPSSSS